MQLKGKQPKLAARQQTEITRTHATGEYTIVDLTKAFFVGRPGCLGGVLYALVPSQVSCSIFLISSSSVCVIRDMACRSTGGAMIDVTRATRTTIVYVVVLSTPRRTPVRAMTTSMTPRAFIPVPRAMPSGLLSRLSRAPT